MMIERYGMAAVITMLSALALQMVILTPLIKLRACRDNVRVATGSMEMRGGNGYIEDWVNSLQWPDKYDTNGVFDPRRDGGDDAFALRRFAQESLRRELEGVVGVAAARVRGVRR